VLLTFSRAGALPLGKMGERLQVHPTSVTSIVDRLEAAGHVVRRRHPEDGRAVLAEITDSGRAVVEAATADLVSARFALGAVPAEDLRRLSELLRPVRQAAGDF
jgi:DNA-binding MarR family transcriptional regulator